MKWTNWNSIRSGFLFLAQSTLFSILISPWLQLAARTWQFPPSSGVLWTLATMLISIVAVKNATSRSKEGLLGVALGMFIPIIFASLLRLPLILFIPLMLACFLVAVRFNDYPQRARFAVDWALGSMLLIVTSSLEATLALQVTVPSVLLFLPWGSPL